MVRNSRSPGRSHRSEDYGRDRPNSGRPEPRRKDDRRRDNRDDDREDSRYSGRGGGGRGGRNDRESSYRGREERGGGHSSRENPGTDGDRDARRDNDRRREDRGGPSRRSASPRHRSSRPHSGSRSKSRSKSPEDKAKPNFAPSGLLAAATKTVKHGDGTKTVLKYHEPPEARKPVTGWRFYVFKGKEQVDLLHIHRQSAYLFGRDRTVADVTLDHPSCSKQHAVIQFRQVREKNEFGETKSLVKPFVIDLESTNQTHVNDEAIPTSRYYELKVGDVVKFGESAREYVLLSEDAA